MRLIVTRPQAQATAWVERLSALGVDVVALPLLAILPAADAAAVHQAWEHLDVHALVVFVSPSAVQAFFGGKPDAAVWPPGTEAACTGPGTSAALLAAGVPRERIVEPAADSPSFDSEALWAGLSSRSWAGQRVLVVRGEQGRDWLANQLRTQGAQVSFVVAYRRADPQLDAAAQRLLDQACRDAKAHVWHFSSSEAVHALGRFAPAAQWMQAQALVSHPRIAQTAREAGFGRVTVVGVRPEDVAACVQGPPIESDAP